MGHLEKGERVGGELGADLEGKLGFGGKVGICSSPLPLRRGVCCGLRRSTVRKEVGRVSFSLG